MKRKSSSIFFCIGIFLFIFGIATFFLGRVICTRSNDNYTEIQPESFVPDVIEEVWYDEELKQLYVCYNDANCVNVYTETGKFLWCVATPYIRNSNFELQEEKLIIYGDGAYIYNSKDGTFLGLENEENLDLGYDYEDTVIQETYTKKTFKHDMFNVYEVSENDTMKEIISRPVWHQILNPFIGFMLAFIGAVFFGISLYSEKHRDYQSVKKEVVFTNKPAKFIKNYFNITTYIHLGYTLLNIVFAFFTDWMIIGIIPITIHMILSSIVLYNIKDHMSVSTQEMYVIDFWSASEIASYIIAFLSVIVASAIAG